LILDFESIHLAEESGAKHMLEMVFDLLSIGICDFHC